MLHVSPPDEAYFEAFMRMLDDYDAHDPASGEQFTAGRADFAAYVAELRDEERGVGLPDGYVPCSHRWLIDDGEIVGIARVRHSIAHPLLEREGGHIGYDVPPSHRRRGNGVAALAAGLDRARQLGLTQVLVCTAADNVPSRAVIQRCGGRLEDEIYSEPFGCVVSRYRIGLAETARHSDPAGAETVTDRAAIPDRLPALPGDIAVAAMSLMFEMPLGSRLTFDGRLDPATLSRATRLLLDLEPILGCWFQEKAFSAQWVRCARLDEESYFSMAETDDPDAEYANFHGTPFADRGPRLVVRLVRSPLRDDLCVRFDHFAGDGWCAIEVTHLLAETYTRLLANPGYVPEPRLSPRPTHADVWQALTDEQRAAAARSMPFKGQRWKGTPHAGSGTGLVVRTLTLPAERVAALREYAHLRGGTVNDAIVAALVRSVAAIYPPAENVRPGVSVSADTRRLVPDGDFNRVCLLATTQTVEIDYRLGESFERTLGHVSEAVKPHKQCLWSISGSIKGPSSPIVFRFFFRLLTALMLNMRLIAPVTMNLGPFDETRLVFGDLRPVSAVASGVIPNYAGFPLTISYYRGALTLWSGFREERMAPELIDRCLEGIGEELVGAAHEMTFAEQARQPDAPDVGAQ